MIICSCIGISLVSKLSGLLLVRILTTNVCLIELIQNGPRSLIIDIRNLGHNLTSSLPLIGRGSGGRCYGSLCLSRANLSSSVVFSFIGLLVYSLIRRIHTQIGKDRGMLLIIVDSRFLKEFGQICHTISIRSVKSIPSEGPELTLGHGLCLLHLLRIQCDLVGVDSSGGGMHTKVLRFVWGLGI